MARAGSDMVTLKIPRPLYQRLRMLIAGTGFRSVTEFSVYVLRDLAAQPASRRREQARPVSGRMTRAELAAARKRLQELGYL